VKTQNIVIKKQRCSVERLPSIENYSDCFVTGENALKMATIMLMTRLEE